MGFTWYYWREYSAACEHFDTELRIYQSVIKKLFIKRWRRANEQMKRNWRCSSLFKKFSALIRLALEADIEKWQTHREALKYLFLRYILRLIRELCFKLHILAWLQHFIAYFHDLILVNISCNGKDHVVKIIESVVTLIKKLRCYLSNSINSSCNIYLYRVVYIQSFQQIIKALSFRRICTHFYFLTDYSLLLSHRLFCKIRLLNKVKKYFKRILPVFRATERICRFIKRRESICVGTSFCI